MITKLIEILRILSDTSVNQTTYILELGTYPLTDEFALMFCNTYEVVLGNLEEGNEIPNLKGKAQMNLDQIYKIFNDMSRLSNNSFWNVSSLNSKEWNCIRYYAHEALQLL